MLNFDALKPLESVREAIESALIDQFCLHAINPDEIEENDFHQIMVKPNELWEFFYRDTKLMQVRIDAKNNQIEIFTAKSF